MRLSETVLGSPKSQGGLRDCEVLQQLGEFSKSTFRAGFTRASDCLRELARVAESLPRFLKEYEGLLPCTRVSEIARRSPIKRENKGARDSPSTYENIRMRQVFRERTKISDGVRGFPKAHKSSNISQTSLTLERKFSSLQLLFLMRALSVN